MSDERLFPYSPEPSPRRVSVSELTREIKRLLETGVGFVEVEGEISNWSSSARGHAYFSLKDRDALLSCVLFQGMRARLRFDPADGMRVAASGQISVYAARGQYQLIVSAMEETGLGDLYRRFLELKEKLEREGLFDPERKRPLPPVPRRIGVVTSPTGAALRDILHIIARRFPGVEVVVAPTLVQGDAAPASIVAAIERVNRLSAGQAEPVDVLIVARGGGSIEDLWAFNDERVARAIRASRIPVVSGVGHETDFTIADFAADLRAPTPSAAAEVVVAEVVGLQRHCAQLNDRMRRALLHWIESGRLRLQRLQHSWGLRQPLDIVREATQRLDDFTSRQEIALRDILRDGAHRLESAAARLGALNPEAVLARGYSIVTRARDGRLVTREKQVRVGDHLDIRLSEGQLRAAVIPPGEDLFDGFDGSKQGN